MEGRLGLGVARAESGLGQHGSRDGSGEEGGSTREGEDGGGIEAGPGADVADVPPEVLGVGVTEGEGDGPDQRGCGVGSREEVEEGGGGSWLRGGGEAQGGVSSGSEVAAREDVEVGLLRRERVRGHGTVGGVAELVKSGGIEGAA